MIVQKQKKSSWGHNLTVISKTKSIEEAFFYLNKIIQTSILFHFLIYFNNTFKRADYDNHTDK